MKTNGFTLIELMIVVTIIGILASIAIPAYQDYTIRAQVVESFSITGELKLSIKDYYEDRGRFPGDNTQAGVPEPQFLIGNYVSEVDVVDGAMHVRFGNYVNAALDGEVLTRIRTPKITRIRTPKIVPASDNENQRESGHPKLCQPPTPAEARIRGESGHPKHENHENHENPRIRARIRTPNENQDTQNCANRSRFAAAKDANETSS